MSLCLRDEEANASAASATDGSRWPPNLTATGPGHAQSGGVLTHTKACQRDPLPNHALLDQGVNSHR